MAHQFPAVPYLFYSLFPFLPGMARDDTPTPPPEEDTPFPYDKEEELDPNEAKPASLDSVSKSGPVRFFGQIWKDHEPDRFKTSLDRSEPRPVFWSKTWFRPVQTSLFGSFLLSNIRF